MTERINHDVEHNDYDGSEGSPRDKLPADTNIKIAQNNIAGAQFHANQGDEERMNRALDGAEKALNTARNQVLGEGKERDNSDRQLE